MSFVKVCLLAMVIQALVRASTADLQSLGERGNCNHYYNPTLKVDQQITPVASPVCRGFDTALSDLFGLGSGVSGNVAAVSQAVERMNDITKVAAAAAKSFGVFGAAFGFAASLTSPSPDDILEKVNDAFAEITSEMNHRFQQLKEYVDQRVINSDVEDLNRDYRALATQWTNCLTDRRLLQCQRQVLRRMEAEGTAKFMLKEFKSKSKVSYPYDTKKLEASLLVFRDFASTHLYALRSSAKCLVVDDPSASAGEKAENKKDLKSTLEDIKRYGKTYNDYAVWAYGEIERNQREYHQRNIKSFHEKAHEDDYRGTWWKCLLGDVCYRVWLTLTIKPKCTTMSVDGQHSCEVFRETTHSYHEGTRDLMEVHRPEINRSVNKAAREMCESSFAGFMNDLRTFWRTELMRTADLWEEASRVADNELKSMAEASV
ncbi:uncharacterized protein LOC5508448 [Nematostella vectensis]|nr:uncharacterized protein LOC5508448 [Nematostella vectensis]XP_048576317.1 uncharacterized protein LOC5508448 [Nematostella vectensis]XP_048576318.1 uncharacterized protein LOC5508448 [Nematostella vectensis]XP_048576319.1 uncharacterized protein LOC5508448 [Nematostella vectensis]